MASGSIISECPICNEFIWEDEEYIVTEFLIHAKCEKIDKLTEINSLALTLSEAERTMVLSFIRKLLAQHDRE